MDPYVALICFPVIFLGELPDKTMFASLLMATHGRPRQVWLGAAGAFAVHVVLAVTIVGIPFAWAHLKLAGIALWPIGRAIVPA